MIESVYEAALRPAHWTEVLKDLSGAVGAKSSSLQVFDRSSATGSTLWSHGIPDEAIAAYPAWMDKNPHIQSITPFVRDGLVVQNTSVRKDEFLRSEFHNEYSRHFHPTYPAGGGVVFATGAMHVTLAVDRDVSSEPFGSAEGRLFALLMPHLQRAMLVYKRLGDAELAQATDLQMLNLLDFAVILLSRSRTVVAMNDVARGILSAGEIVKVSPGGELQVRDGYRRTQVEKLIDSACAGWSQSHRVCGGALTLETADGDGLLELVASPIRLQQFPLAPNPPAAVLFLRDPQRSSQPIARLQQVYGLTLSEARVAQRLGSGDSVADLSASLRIGVSTARTHVRRLLEKVGARSLSDLTRRIAGLPPIR